MRYAGLLIVLCISVSAGQMIVFESEIEELQPLGSTGFLMISSLEDSPDITSVSRLDQEASILWSTALNMKYIYMLHAQESIILVMGKEPIEQGYQVCINELDRNTGEVLSENTYPDSLIGCVTDCIELPDGQILIFGGNGVYSLNPDMTVEYIATLPEITGVEGASLMADGNLEVAGSIFGEQLILLWITREGALIDIEDWGLISGAHYSMQPSNTAILVAWQPYYEYDQDNPARISFRSVMSSPGENLFTYTVYDSFISCATDNRNLIIVRKVSSGTLCIEKFQDTGDLVWTNEIDIPMGDYSYAYLRSIVPCDSGFALAGYLHSYDIGKLSFILFLDDQGDIIQEADPADYLNLSFSPNPFGGSGILKATLDVYGTISIDVIDLSGRLVHSFGPVTQAGEVAFTIEDLPSGIYLINALYDGISGISLTGTLKVICINP